MVLSRLTKITGPGIATDTNWLGNNADFTGITTTATSFNIGVTTIHSTLIEAHNIKSTGIITATGGSFSGNVTAVDGTFSGNVSIAGTLTYEDVTNIDSVGIITAPALDVDDFLDVGSSIKLGNAGVITATSFVGSGAALTGIDATAIKDSGGNVKIQAQASGAIHSGVSTFQDIDVDGHTNLDNVSIAGVSTFSKNINLPDSSDATDGRIKFGATQDMMLFHYGGANYIDVTTNLNIRGSSSGNTISIKPKSAEEGIKIIPDGAVELYYNNIKMLETNIPSGHNGEVILGQKVHVRHTASGNGQIFPASGNLYLNAKNAETSIMLAADAGVHLFYNNAQKFVTTNTGAVVSGILTATSFVGGLPITSGVDNRVITASSASAIQGESNLTFDGTSLDLPTVNSFIKGGGHNIVQVDATKTYLYGGTGGVQFRTADNSAELINITNDGKLLLGTSTEGHAAADNLTIADSGNCGITIRSGTSNNGNLYFSDGTSGGDEYRGYVNYNHSSNYMILATNGSERLRIDSSGNTHFGSSGTLNDSNTVSIIPSDGRISFGMDGRTSYVTGESACYIYSGEGSSGTTLAGELILQSRSNVNRNITFVTGTTPTAQMIVYGSGGVFAHTKNNFLLNEFRRGDTSTQYGPLSTSWATDTTISDTISNYQRGQRIIIRCTVPCGIALGNSSGANYGGTNVRIKVTGNTSGGNTYSNNRPVWYRADGANTHETTINLFICVYINENDTTFSNGETLTVNIQGQKNGGGAGTGTHYLGGWSTVKEITIERYIKEL